MSKPFNIAFFAVAIIASVPAIAQTPGSERRIAASEYRDQRQEARIVTGTANGGINATEAARLNNQQARIDNTQTRLAADGYFSRRDYARVDYRQDKANRSIYRARYNRR